MTLNGTVQLTLALGFNPADGTDSFIIVDNDGTDAIGGSSSG